MTAKTTGKTPTKPQGKAAAAKPSTRAKAKPCAKAATRSRTSSAPAARLTLQPEGEVRSTAAPTGATKAHFGPLREPLIAFIEASPVIVGCVAWITQRDILAALARRPVALVVQKEDYWKKADGRGQALVRSYTALRGGLCGEWLPERLRTPMDPILAKHQRQGRTTPLPPISCVGYQGHGTSAPLMHHKFIVRCIEDRDPATGAARLVPAAVWTGSFNFSGAANDSLENAVEIHDPTIAAAYLAEYALVASMAEPMAWRFRKPRPGAALSPTVPRAGTGAGEETPVVIPAKPTKKSMGTTRVVKAGTTTRAKAAKKAAARPARKTATATRSARTVQAGVPASKPTTRKRATTRSAAKSTARPTPGTTRSRARKASV